MSKIKIALDTIKTLDDLMTERIEELHKIQGMQQARHAYIYYRSLLWEIEEQLITFKETEK